MAELSIASDFPAATRDQWMKLVEGVLKGAPFERKLVSTTYDGIAIQPLYPKAEGRAPIAGRTPGTPWAVMARVDHPDADTANAMALEDLDNGATGLQLVFAGSQGACGFGLADGSAATLDRVLDGVVLDAGIRLELDLSLACKDAAEALAASCARQNLDPASLDIGFGFDPLGQMALMGGSPVPWRAACADVRGTRGRHRRARVRRHGRGGGWPARACGGRIGSAGAGLRAGQRVAYLRALEAGGIELEQARGMIGFRLAADADQFLTIAKFRALRALWARVEEACGLTPRPIRLHGETAWRMLTRRDPWVNLLRNTVAVFAAGVGGADSVSVLPFTSAIGLPDAFARRLARNTQLVLLEESNLARVADPAAGAGGMEALTDELAQAAWALFQRMEAKGGLYGALADGAFQADVAKVRAARAKAVATRRDPLTGTSEFPDIAEKPVTVLRPHAAARAASVSGWTCAARDQALRALRGAARRGRRGGAAHGRPAPRVPRHARARSRTSPRAPCFARNLFEAGGVAAPGNDGFCRRTARPTSARAGRGVQGLRRAARMPVLVRRALRRRGRARPPRAEGSRRGRALAGRPARRTEAALRAAGVDGFIFAGCDVLATLAGAHRLGLTVRRDFRRVAGGRAVQRAGRSETSSTGGQQGADCSTDATAHDGLSREARYFQPRDVP